MVESAGACRLALLLYKSARNPREVAVRPVERGTALAANDGGAEQEIDARGPSVRLARLERGQCIAPRCVARLLHGSVAGPDGRARSRTAEVSRPGRTAADRAA